MHTRGRPTGEESWPAPGPLRYNNPKDLHDALKSSCTAVLSAEEQTHFAHCLYHFGGTQLYNWERRGWYRPPGRKNVSLPARCAAILICGHRCGRPFLRAEFRDLVTVGPTNSVYIKANLRSQYFFYVRY